MKTPVRILISGGVALAVFAVSFGVARAATESSKPIDQAIEVPQTVSANAPVLSPVDVGGDTAAVPVGLSPEVGTAHVTFPAGQEDAASTPPTPSPNPSASSDPQPGADIIAAAAALDSAAGESSDLIATPLDASTSPSPTPQPTETSGVDETPASDPCADTPSDSPGGLAATLDSLHLDPNLRVFAQADPADNVREGGIDWCPATAVPAGTLRMGAFSTDLGTVTIDYWPTGQPSAVKHMTPAVAQHYSDGSARYCGHTDVLVTGAYDATVTVQTADERYSNPTMFHFDSRGRPTTPTMYVLPLGHNWVYARVLHGPTQSAQIVGLPTSGGDNPSCSNTVGAASLSAPIAGHTSEVTADELALHNYNPAFTRSTSTVFYVPEGTSAKICGLTFNGGEPSWESSVPDRVESATVIAPQSWEAVVTVRSMTTNRPGHVEISATGALGGACGYTAVGGNDSPASDAATTARVQTQVCALAGQNIQLDVQTWYTKDGGGAGTSRHRSVIAGSTCTGPCPAPAPLTYNVFLPGLGNDGCPDSAEGDCAVARSTRGAVATIDVTWQQATASMASAWSVSGTADDTVPDVLPTDPRMDTTTSMTADFVGGDFYHAGASGIVKFDRPVTYTAQAVGDCFTNDATSSTASGSTSSTLDATGASTGHLQFANLCVGTSYSVVMRYADAHGHGGIAAAAGTPGIVPTVAWFGGMFQTPQKYMRIVATIDVNFRVPNTHDAVDGQNANWGVYNSWIYVDGYDHGIVPSMRKADGSFCYQNSPHATSAPAAIVLPLKQEYALGQAIDIQSDYLYWDSRRPDCSFTYYNSWGDTQIRTVSLYQIQNAIPLPALLRSAAQPANAAPPFSYTVTFTGTMQDSPNP